MFKELHPNIKVRIYTSFLSRILGYTIFPFMAIYFTRELNATWAGIIIMIQTVTQFVSSLYGGYLADSLGRKRIMVSGELMKLLALSGMLVSNSPLWVSPWFTFFMLIIISIGSGIINPAADAMLVDVSNKETRAFMYSINYWANNLSLMIGMIIGGWFFKEHLFGLLGALLGMSSFTSFITIYLIKDTYQINKNEIISQSYGVKSALQSYLSVIKNLPFVFFSLGGIAILSIEYQRNNFIAVKFADEFKTRIISFEGIGNLTVDGVKLLSLLTIENTLIVVLFATAVAKWIRHRNEKAIMYFGFLLFGVGYSMMVISNTPLILVISVIVFSVGELLFVPTRQSLLVDIIDDSKRGSYMAFDGLVYQISKMIAAFGIIVGNYIGGKGMALSYIILALIGIILCRKGSHSNINIQNYRC